MELIIVLIIMSIIIGIGYGLYSFRRRHLFHKANIKNDDNEYNHMGQTHHRLPPQTHHRSPQQQMAQMNHHRLPPQTQPQMAYPQMTQPQMAYPQMAQQPQMTQPQMTQRQMTQRQMTQQSEPYTQDYDVALINKKRKFVENAIRDTGRRYFKDAGNHILNTVAANINY